MRPAEKSALDAVALEDLRQPAAQSDGRGVDTFAAVGLDRFASAWFWTLAVIGIILIPSVIASALNVLRKSRSM
jgi:hypothetical protein